MPNALQKKCFYLRNKCPKIKQSISSCKAINFLTMNRCLNAWMTLWKTEKI